MNNTAIVPTRGDELMFMPVMDMQVAIERRNHLVKFVQSIMKDGVDYGKIPGAGDKPTLLKPGAEKLATFFGLTPIFIPISVTEDWTGDEHKGEPFFYYRYRCELHRNGNLIASSEGSCNTWESKYRYRKGERVCPECGQAAIIKGKKEYGGGWVCFKKKGGCDTKFKDGDNAIEKQDVGRILNPDVADLVNTVQKMAQKRSLIAATLLAVNASEFFTQDIEDMVIDGEWTPAETKPAQPQRQNAPQTSQKAQGNTQSNSAPNPFDDDTAKPETLSEAQLQELNIVGREFYDTEWDEIRPKLVQAVSKGAVSSSKELSPKEADILIKGIKKKATEAAKAKASQVTVTA